MKELFKEEIECEFIEQSTLYQSYVSAKESLKNNDCFSFFYRLDDSFALELSRNIFLYHLIPKDGELYASIVPWFYADSKKYMGDTWWEQDDEIIDSIKNLSIVEFFKRYKGY